jgi:DNA-directed RNA polymerase specialized sigma24 family protein
MKKKTPKNKTNKQTKNNENDGLHGVSQEEFLRVLDSISKRLGHKFKFGYHSFEDMRQQAAIFALEGLERYDHSRPLENFLWTHVRNRLFNYKRNNYQRPDKPCLTCPFFDKTYKCSNNQCTEFTNKQDCELYAAWAARNEAKKNIMQPYGMETELPNKNPTDPLNLVTNKELIDFLDINIESEYRETYLKIKHGTKVSRQDTTRLKSHIEEIMEKYSWKNPDQKNEDN